MSQQRIPDLFGGEERELGSSDPQRDAGHDEMEHPAEGTENGFKKICLVCTHGGHLTEMLHLMDSFDRHDVFFLTTESMRTRHLDHRKYLIKNVKRTNPLSFLVAAFRIADVYQKEKPDLVVSMGAGVAVPAVAMARLMGIHTIFVESLCRVRTLSPAGRVVLPLANVFLVQWQDLLGQLPRKAQYWGRIV